MCVAGKTWDSLINKDSWNLGLGHQETGRTKDIVTGQKR